jgi:hypothetical protein
MDRAFSELPRPVALECIIGACIDRSMESFFRDGMAWRLIALV